MPSKNSDANNIKKTIDNSDKQVFNSKLFIDLNFNEELYQLNENKNSENNTEDTDNSFELEESNYLSNELIEELDFCNNKEKSPKEENKNMNNSKIVDSLLSLANNGYSFTPKNYKALYIKNPIIYNNNYVNSNVTKNLTFFNNNNNSRGIKKNWICYFCKNLNYSFRRKCNRCNVKKEESDKRNHFLMNFVV